MVKLDLMGTVEIRARLRVSKARVHQLVREKGFPEPVAKVSGTTIWLTKDVEAWIRKYRPKLAEDAEGD
jgi:predicted DNA-binding transcriptional regulator AlpA